MTCCLASLKLGDRDVAQELLDPAPATSGAARSDDRAGGKGPGRAGDGTYAAGQIHVLRYGPLHLAQLGHQNHRVAVPDRLRPLNG